jgi:large subunit ribosomal protein L35
MPKMKTSRAAKKRFRVTGNDKVVYLKAGLRHNLGPKTGKRKRVLARPETLAGPARDLALRLLGGR